MLRRKPTAITLTSEDVAAYEDSRRAASAVSENNNPNAQYTNDMKASGTVDPNDELKPLPGDKARITRTGAMSRDERILGR